MNIMGAVSNEVWLALIAIAVPIATMVNTAVIAWIGRKAVRAADDAKSAALVAADKAAGVVVEVKKTLEENTASSDKKLEAVADVAHEVKKTLEVNTTNVDQKLKEIADVGKTTHDLCNHLMSEQLKKTAEALRRNANSSKKKADILEAEQAEKLFHDHVSRQNEVDTDDSQRSSA